jgi:MYXO-CTERM domain-containing protein
MNELRSSLLAAAVALVTAWSGAAFADIPPPDECSGGAGTPCNNAGPASDQPGICVTTTCAHTGPGPDGGIVTTQNPCVLCEVTDGGSSTSSSSSSSGTSTTSSGGSSGGCAVGSSAGGRTAAGAMLLVGLGLLASRRRRRG